MNNFFLLIYLFVGLSIELVAQNPIVNEIQKLENQRFKAQIEKDSLTLKRILADDLIYTHSSAIVESKQEYINSIMKNRWDYREIVVEKNQVRVYKNTAIVNGIAKITIAQNDKLIEIRMSYTDVYIKRKQWQMVSWQSTRINPN